MKLNEIKLSQRKPLQTELDDYVKYVEPKVDKLKLGKFLTEKQEVDLWCRRACLTAFAVNEDGTVDVMTDVDISNIGLTLIPVRFGDVSGKFDVSQNPLISLQGSPRILAHAYDAQATNITSLEGITPRVDRLTINQCINIKSFHDIHKHLTAVNRINMADMISPTHLLGLLKITGLMDVLYTDRPPAQVKADIEINLPLKILNRYLPVKSNKDFFDCQAALIDAGFDEAAKL